MKKKIILSLLMGAITSVLALDGEMAYLYKDPRIMGMGGANVAVGGYSSSVFSNPAGIASIKKEDGYVVDILIPGLAASDAFRNFISSSSDSDKNNDNENEILNTLKKYNGQNFHVDLSYYSAVSNNMDSFAWSIGLLTAVDVNFQTHVNSTGSSGILATSSRTYGGLCLTGAKEFHTKYGRVDVGAGFKYITQTSYEGSLRASALVGGDIVESLKDTYEQSANGFGLDLGAIYFPLEESIWHPAFGLSVSNMGFMSMDDWYGKRPITVNVGASITPEVKYIDKFVIAVDYVDLFNANTIRLYDPNIIDNRVTFTDYTDSDFMKRLRLGIGIGLIDTRLFSTQINTGLYQGSYTAGLDMTITIFKLNIATYEEQIGTGNTDLGDRRYMVQLAIGW